MAKLTDTITYAQLQLVLQGVSENYSNGGNSGTLTAPAVEVLQEVWTEAKSLNPEAPGRF